MILAILQARMGSTRLPGKVLMKILGKPMLELQIERIVRAESIDKLVVEKVTGIILEKLLLETVTFEVFDPSEIADPNTLLIVLFEIVTLVGGLIPDDGLPQHNIP